MRPSSSTTSSERGLWAWAAAAFLAPALLYAGGLVGGLALAPHLGPDHGLDAKRALLAARPALIFAGDSRAARHLEPATAARLLGWPAEQVANVAVSAGDAVMAADLAGQEPAAFAGAAVVVSVSAFQVNDGDRERLSGALLRRLTPWQALRLCWPDVVRPLHHHLRASLQDALRPPPAPQVPPAGGFEGVDASLGPYDLVALRTNPWYEPWRPDGYKQLALAAALAALKSRARALLVYNGPLAPSYRALAELAPHHRHEADHAAALGALCRELGVAYRDYRALPGLDDSDFYNATHLNVRGARRFTAHVVADLRADSLLPAGPAGQAAFSRTFRRQPRPGQRTTPAARVSGGNAPLDRSS